MPHFWKFGILPMVFTMMTAEGAGTKYKVNGDLCSKVKCENGGVCMTIVSITGNNSGTRAQCKCGERFTGPRCESEIHLKSISTTWESAKLEIMLTERSEQNINKPVNELDVLVPKFTLLHWANKSSDACSMIPEVEPKEHVITNLESDMEYRICAMSGTVRWCKYIANSTGSQSNCVVVRTSKAKPAASELREFLVVISLSVVFLISVCILFCVLKKRKDQNVCSQTYTSPRKPIFFNLRMRNRRKREKSNDLFLPPIQCEPLETIVIHPPSSPGRPQHKLSQSVRGHTSTFSAKNDKAMPLTTVLEYVPNEQMEDTESSLMVHKPTEQY